MERRYKPADKGRLGNRVAQGRHIGPKRIDRPVAPPMPPHPPAPGQVLKAGAHMHGHPARPNETINWQHTHAKQSAMHPLFARHMGRHGRRR
jgi:hypothetical protein